MSPSALSAVAGITALIGSLKGLVNYGKNIVNMASHFEQTEKGLETVLQSAEKGKALFEDLRKFSFETTFGVDELASASTQLLNVGVASSELKNDLRMIGDLAQGDKINFQELTSVFSKIQASGKASAMQLQQIALRGIPINQTLKEMGVTGTASAKEITMAFEKLTAEGGNFHGAMEKINDTIEGKRGFITDTLKEISVNLGEITGLTDVYKQYLDILYEVLNNFNNKLMELNENPVVKAIIQGVIITAIGGIIGLIVGSLIPALTLVITKLIAIASLKSLITGGLIGLAVGGVVALGVAMASASSNTDGLTNSTKNLNVELAEQYRLTNDIDKLEKARADKEFYTQEANKVKEEIENLQKRKAQLENDIKIEQDKINKAKEFAGEEWKDFVVGQTVDINVLTESGTADFANDVTYLEAQMSELDSTISELNEKVEKYNSLINSSKGIEKVYSPIEERTKQLKDLKKSYDDYLLTIRNNKQLKEFNKQLVEIENYRKLDGKTVFDEKGNATIFKFDDKQKNEIDKTIKYIKKSIENIKINNFVSDQNDWQKALQRIFGFTNKEAYAGKNATGVTAVNEYLKNAENKQSNLDSFGIYQTNLEKFSNTVNDLESKLLALATATDESGKLIYDGTEESVKNLKKAIDDVENKLFHSKLGQKLLSATLGDSDAGTFAESLKENKGNVGKALADTLVSSLIKIIGGLKGMELIMNPINDILKAFEPLLKSIMVVLYIILYPIKLIAEWLGKILSFFFGDMADLWDKLAGEQESEAERLKKINEQYKNLLISMKEQEEYYIAQKKRINADTYASDVYKVNDMILTPQGNFSTAPDDYIIATKNPNNLGNGGVRTLQPIINDYGGNNVEVQTRTNSSGMEELIINISKKVADDYATGRNGWNNAFSLKQSNLSGRSVQ